MPNPISFQQTNMLLSSASSITHSIFHYCCHQRSIIRYKYNLFWILISLHIFIALVHCNDDTISPSIQPFPQKRAGGKFNRFSFAYLLLLLQQVTITNCCGD